MSVRIIVDSTADLAPGIREQLKIIPLSIRFGDKEYTHGVDITNEQFYQMLPESPVLPTTSQPTPFAFEEVYREVTDAGDTAVVITVSGKLSGTYQSATIAAADFEGRIFVVDSRNVAIGAGILVEYALDLVNQGLSAEAIFTELIAQRENIQLYALLDTLEYLKKGGRISSAVAFAGGLLSIKPIICVRNGVVEMMGKARGVKQGTASLISSIQDAGPDHSKPFLLGYTGQSREQLDKFIQGSTDVWNTSADAVPTSIVGSVVGVHAGPGAIAVAFFKKN